LQLGTEGRRVLLSKEDIGKNYTSFVNPLRQHFDMLACRVPQKEYHREELCLRGLSCLLFSETGVLKCYVTEKVT